MTRLLPDIKEDSAGPRVRGHIHCLAIIKLEAQTDIDGKDADSMLR